MSRWIKFFLVMALGIAAGLLYGWFVNPVEYIDIAPVSLREDYKTDFVLMTAEAYQVDHDLGSAVRRLAQLGDAPPSEIVAAAIAFALENGYTPPDLALMQALGEAVLTWNPGVELQLP
jgi:hypothetical protein